MQADAKRTSGGQQHDMANRLLRILPKICCYDNHKPSGDVGKYGEGKLWVKYDDRYNEHQLKQSGNAIG